VNFGWYIWMLSDIGGVLTVEKDYTIKQQTYEKINRE
jgi:hypothetical protein